MFGFESQAYRELKQVCAGYEKLSNEQNEKIRKLKEELKDKEAQLEAGIAMNAEKSIIQFSLDDDLKVTIRSSVREQIIPALIDKEYINPDIQADDYALQLTMLLIANETTEQLLLEHDEAQQKLDS